MTKKDLVHDEITAILSNQWATKPITPEYALSYFTHQFQHEPGFDQSWITGSSGWEARFGKKAPTK